MDEREQRNKIQCIVDEGIVLNRHDMVRVLRDLGHVRYTDTVEDRIRATGEGYVTSVFANFKGSTIIVNKRLYINVNSFSYMRVSRLEDETAAFDLVDEQRCVRLVPLFDPYEERRAYLGAEPALVTSAPHLEALLGEEMAELLFEEDPDEIEEDG